MPISPQSPQPPAWWENKLEKGGGVGAGNATHHPLALAATARFPGSAPTAANSTGPGRGILPCQTRLAGEPALSILSVLISGCFFRGRSAHPSMPRPNDTLIAWMTPNHVAPNGIART
jgi:hypothetical protein